MGRKKTTEPVNENLVTKADFARIQGVTRGRVSQIFSAGRLVCDDAGKVFVIESKARIGATADTGHANVIIRHDRERVAKQLEKEKALQAELDLVRERLLAADKYNHAIADRIWFFLRALSEVGTTDSPAILKAIGGDLERLERLFYGADYIEDD
jgi:hypothetical protein